MARVSLIAPCLLFKGEAEDAASFYVSIFPDAAITAVSRYGAGAPLPQGTALLVEFTLAGQRFQAPNGGPQTAFTEAISLSIVCKDAGEVDHYLDALTAMGGKPIQCAGCGTASACPGRSCRTGSAP